MSKSRVSRWVSCAVALALVAGLALPAAAAPRSEGSFWTQVTAWIASWWGSLAEDLGAPALLSDRTLEKDGSFPDPSGR